MTIDDVKAELARGQAEAVRMLDEWYMASPHRSYDFSHGADAGTAACTVWDHGAAEDKVIRIFTGDSVAAARANAAEAIRGEL